MASLYTGIHGHLDSIELVDILRFEKEFLANLRLNQSSLLAGIREKKTLDGNEEALIQAIGSFKENFVPTHSEASHKG